MNPDPPAKLPDNDGPPATPLSEPGAHVPPTDMDYALLRLIGRGGYGEVWLVRDRSGNYLACKVVYRESFRQDRPYEREYEGICKFEPVSRAGENQIKILHVGRRDHSGYFYYIMELADDANTGREIHPDQYVPKTLKTELERRKKLPAGECIQIGLSLSAALGNLHQCGLIHRDIKPSNIIFVRGAPKLADIGLVTDMDVTVSYVGTEGFIPPEGPTSPRADVYGLGKVLYEISTGMDRLDYPELPANFAELPDRETLLELNAIVAKACEVDVDKRYASAQELRADLALLARGKSIRGRRATKRNWLFAARAGAVLVAIGLAAGGFLYLSKHIHSGQGASANVAPAKIPVPDAARLAQSESEIENEYGGQWNGGSAAGKRQAAIELFNRSSAESDPATEMAALRVASQLAIEAGDFSQAMEICDSMGQRFQMDIWPVKAELLSQADDYAQTARNEGEFAAVCVTTGFQAIAADDYAGAKQIAGLAKSAAQNSGDAHLIQEASFLDEETTRCASQFESVKHFAAILREKPDDPAANLAVGKFLCFIKNDWTTGLPLMARGDDAVLKSVVEQEINGKLEMASEQIALGDSWWNLSTAAPDDQKLFYQLRARYWYLKGIAHSAAPDRSHLREELSGHINAVPTEPGEIHIVSRVNGAETIDIYSDEIQWRGSGRGALGNKINEVNLGDFGANDLEIIKNCEATWLMPAAVDFSTARLAIDHKWGRGGRAKLTIYDDHAHLVLAHPRRGATTLDVTVTFGTSPDAGLTAR